MTATARRRWLGIAAFALAAPLVGAQEPAATTRVYDVRALLAELPDRPARWLDAASVFRPAADEPLPPTDSVFPALAASALESALVELVDPSGALGRDLEIDADGGCVCTATPAMQAPVAEALGRLLAVRRRTLHVRARAVRLTLEALPRALALAAGTAPRAEVEAWLATLPPEAVAHDVTVTTLAGLRAHAIDGERRAFVGAIDVEVAERAVAVDPVPWDAHLGLLLDVRPAVGPDGAVRAALRAGWSSPIEERRLDTVAGPIDLPVVDLATWAGEATLPANGAVVWPACGARPVALVLTADAQPLTPAGDVEVLQAWAPTPATIPEPAFGLQWPRLGTFAGPSPADPAPIRSPDRSTGPVADAWRAAVRAALAREAPDGAAVALGELLLVRGGPAAHAAAARALAAEVAWRSTARVQVAVTVGADATAEVPADPAGFAAADAPLGERAVATAGPVRRLVTSYDVEVAQGSTAAHPVAESRLEGLVVDARVDAVDAGACRLRLRVEWGAAGEARTSKTPHGPLEHVDCRVIAWTADVHGTPGRWERRRLGTDPSGRSTVVWWRVDRVQ